MEHEQLFCEYTALVKRIQGDHSQIDGGDEYPCLAARDSFQEQYAGAAKTEFDPFVSGYFPSMLGRHREQPAPQTQKRSNAMKQGTLIYNPGHDRMDIRFGLADYYGGLHCGQCFEVFDGSRWVPTRIEFSDRWYLVGIQTEGGIEGLRVRLRAAYT